MNLEDKKLLEKERKDFIKYLLDNNLDIKIFNSFLRIVNYLVSVFPQCMHR